MPVVGLILSKVQLTPPAQIIPQAVLVQDGDDEVIIATVAEPELPWWKQRRMRPVLSFILVIPCSFVRSFIFIGQGSITTSSTAADADPLQITIAPSSSPTASYGTCGEGQVDNGVCRNSNECCSRFGYCGTKPVNIARLFFTSNHNCNARYCPY